MGTQDPLHGAFCVAIALSLCGPAPADETPVGKFVLVAEDGVGGHYYSQVIYAPTIKAIVSWGTRTHSKPIRAHETQHFLVAENRWIDAWPIGKEKAWGGEFRKWPDWEICSPTGTFYERDGVKMPRPNSSFYQVCWDGHNKRLVFYVGSMTFAYEPTARRWTQIHAMDVADQPPALLLWSSLCYDPVNRQVLLFGGGGIDAPDGRPHTWALDVTNDKWRRLDLDVEPPPRCNSRMVYDARNKLIVLFGGDGQDRGLADTWVFDTVKRKWQQRVCPGAPRGGQGSPHPRCCHAMAPLSKSGLVLLVGGHPIHTGYRWHEKLARQAWVYDAAGNKWRPLDVDVPKFHWASMENIPGTDEVILVTADKYGHGRKTYRFRYGPSVATAVRQGHPPNTPTFRNIKSTKGRTWGTAIFDTDRGLAMKWGGGHSGYQGTDMAFYDVGANRFTIDRRAAFTPDPFERWARRPAGRTFLNQPWARHMRHTCAYDRAVKLGVFTDAGGSQWYDREANERIKHTWLYDPATRRWLEPIAQPFPGGGTRSPIAVPTPTGVVVYQRERMWRFVGQAGKPATWGWREIKIEGADRPRHHEHMTIVYDSKRDRLVFLSAEKKGAGWGHRGDGPSRLWFFGMTDRRWAANPKPAAGGVVTREAVYVPDQDAILAYGPAKADEAVWTRVYLCAENRWLPLPIKTPQYLVHEVALEYDPTHKLALLLWPPSFEADLRPHLLRLDAAKLR